MINKFFYIILIFAIVAALNFISYRHYIRYDITKDKLYSLTKKSQVIANDLKTEVKIYVYFKPEHEMYIMLKNLLNAYQSSSKKIIIKWIDPYYDFEVINALGELGKSFKLNTVLLKTETRHRFVTADELGNYDRRLEQFGIDPKLISFNGESAITGAIIDLGTPTPPTMGLINSHAEKTPKDKDEAGIYSFVRLLSLEGYQMGFIDISKMPEIPSNINILVSIAPRNDFSNEELSTISSFLRKGGSVFIAADPYVHATTKEMMNYNLNPLLNKWGITLENTVVVDPIKHIPYSTPDNLYIDFYSDFEIVKNMKSLPTLFFQARSLGVNAVEDCVVAPLMATSDKGWGEGDFANPKYEFNDGVDKRGPNYIGVASHNQKTNGKLLIFGDSDFLNNKSLDQQGNAKLVENCFYWLSDKSALLDIPAKKSPILNLSLGRNQLIKIFIFCVAGLPLFVLLLGLMVWIRRK